VRRSLQDGGFKIDRIPGFGRKRHMTKGIKL
jgi:tRNA U34 5-methylaminomethyl-2-thiouridine-forming methyltransferase MnmC